MVTKNDVIKQVKCGLRKNSQSVSNERYHVIFVFKYYIWYDQSLIGSMGCQGHIDDKNTRGWVFRKCATRCGIEWRSVSCRPNARTRKRSTVMRPNPALHDTST